MTQISQETKAPEDCKTATVLRICDKSILASPSASWTTNERSAFLNILTWNSFLKLGDTSSPTTSSKSKRVPMASCFPSPSLLLAGCFESLLWQKTRHHWSTWLEYGLSPQGPVYEALFEIAKNYMNADVTGISNCITRYRMSALMDDIAPTKSKCPHDLELLKGLMLLLERLLIEYLGENWDIIEDVLRVNREVDLKKPESHAALKSNRNTSSQALMTQERARKNWQRAYRVAIKQIVMDTFTIKRAAVTMTQLFKELSRGSMMTDDGSDQSMSRRNPTLLLLGGGMAAGKTSVREIIGSDAFWSKVRKDAVVVEADAIKSQDIVFHALKDRLGDDPAVSQMVHDYSTRAAESMLVQAVNDQKDIIFDGTLSWLPFVEQTIAMIRDHEHNYKTGPGYYKDDEGNVHEKYWEIDTEKVIPPGSRLPYRVDLVGVTCDPGVAVARGVWRKIKTGRGVPVSSQLRSHKMFSKNFKAIAEMVDSATLYHTGSNITALAHCGEAIVAPKVICHVSSVTRGELLVNPSAMEAFLKITNLNELATCVADLFHGNPFGRPNARRNLSRTLTEFVDGSPVHSLRRQLMEAHKASSFKDEFK